ncbi:glutathione transport system substrate-binding protein [Paenibacillus sp. UNCCL117]|uniref:ABC transporter substrate-binding protein n=1 Tax=unclassified Paenibacillus TaxID=185978 RepID=UPI000880AAC5|nr:MULTISPECIES: ABC transporter substrate-binding protein [unclassified Paenibacillus]SDD06230.1 glutathione transport system substrate-binding protein [Paenibacillus sp. cl123]SFW31737.1 glutathione transport system substrate-binding protein [Paenibacillus sp. UNCCL117]
MKLKSLTTMMLLVLTLALIASGCSGSGGSSSSGGASSGSGGGDNAKPTTISFGLAGEPATMDPLVQNGTHGRTIKLAIYRGLVNYGKDGKLSNELAESYTVSGDSKNYTFKLRDAKFHNGDAVTAEDVKFTFERIANPKNNATFRNELAIIDKIETPDPKTVTITLKEPFAPFIHYLALPETVIVSKKWAEEKNGDLNANPMGAGPFEFVKWTKGQEMTVKRFDGYYKKDKKPVDNIKFVFYADENTRVNALKAGDVDLVEYVPWKDAMAIEQDSKLKLDSVSGPFMQLQFNTQFAPFSDPRVRKAIAYAIDRNTIINTAFNGRGKPIYGMAIPEGYMGYNKKFESYYEYNIEKAKQLLAEAGYPNGFKAKLLATSQYAFHQQTAVAVQSELKKVGIEVELDLPDWATRIKKNTEGSYDFVVAGTSGDITDGDWLSNFYAGGAVRLNNSAYFDDAEINKLLAEGRKELDEAKRNAIYERLIERALDLSPFVYLSWREQSYGMKANVEGFKNLPGFLSFQSGISLEDVTMK